MSTDFTLEPCQGYVHVRLAPAYALTVASMSRLWSELRAFSQVHGCRSILCEGVNPKRAMSAGEIYQSGQSLSQELLGFQVACYWEGYQIDQLTDLLKDVARNRGVIIQFFASRDEALHWLGVEGAD